MTHGHTRVAQHRAQATSRTDTVPKCDRDGVGRCPRSREVTSEHPHMRWRPEAESGLPTRGRIAAGTTTKPYQSRSSPPNSGRGTITQR